MTLLDRYVLRQTLSSFAIVTGVLTSIMWLTSTLRQLEFLVTWGQGLLTFLGVTSFVLPLILTLIAPFALFIALLFVLNKLNTDSELIVMSACGLSPTRLAWPIAMVAIGITLAVYTMTLVVVPAALSALRDAATAARADLIAQVIQPGRFTTVDQGLTLHVRERDAGGTLHGVFVSDSREAELETTYLGSRGIISRSAAGTFLVLEDGQIIRKPKEGYSSIIRFDAYAIDLSAFAGTGAVARYSPAERPTTVLIADVLRGNSDPRERGRERSELNERFAGPIYILAFAAIAYAALGRARTTRQSRTESVALAIALIVGLRILGFGAAGLAQRAPGAVAFIYAVPIGALVIGAAIAFGSAPAGLRRSLSKLRLRDLRFPGFMRTRGAA